MSPIKFLGPPKNGKGESGVPQSACPCAARGDSGSDRRRYQSAQFSPGRICLHRYSDVHDRVRRIFKKRTAMTELRVFIREVAFGGEFAFVSVISGKLRNDVRSPQEA